MLRMFDLHAEMGDDHNISRAKLYKRNTTIVYAVVGFNNGMKIMGICPDVETSNQVVKSMTLHNDFITACYYPINFSIVDSIVAITEEIKSRIACTNCGTTSICQCVVSDCVNSGINSGINGDITNTTNDRSNNENADNDNADVHFGNDTDTATYAYGRLERSPLSRRATSPVQLSVDPPSHICLESDNSHAGVFPNIMISGVDGITDLDILRAIISANSADHTDNDSDSDNDESIIELVNDS